MSKFALSLLALSALSGCAEGPWHWESSQAYKDGYSDGCTNGSSTAGNLSHQLVRNEARYNSEPDYATGWRNGNRECDGTDLKTNPNNPAEPIDLGDSP